MNMNHKILLASTAILSFTSLMASGKLNPKGNPAFRDEQNAPAYSVMGKDTTCQVFLYSPDPTQGLHLAYLTDNEKWIDVGQLCTSDYGPWGSGKKMYSPSVVQANDGTWRALWSVGELFPQFAVAYSEDLVTWRPQDYPIVAEKGVKSPVAYQMEDGNFDIYIKTAKGKRYVQASQDFRTFVEDSLEASANEILWDKDSVLINGKMQKGDEFEIPAVHLNYIRAWFKALDEENRENNRQIPKTNQELAALVKEYNDRQVAMHGEKAVLTQMDESDRIEAKLVVDGKQTKRISDKLIGIFFEDISRAADGGLCAELLQNGDFEYNKDDRKHSWNATTAWQGVDLSSVSVENGVSKNNPHYAVLGATPIYNIGWNGISILRGARDAKKEGKHAASYYDVSLYARCLNGKNKQLMVALVDEAGDVISQAKVKVVGNEWSEYKAQLVITDKYQGNLEEGKGIRLALIPKGETQVGIDLVSLKPHDTYKGHGLRKDLAEKIAELKPKFVRFPGGCMLHGQGLDNIYHWKETVGPLKDRKPARNLWNYHQTSQLGFYEYFQWCEDMGAEPLPVLAAGVP